MQRLTAAGRCGQWRAGFLFAEMILVIGPRTSYIDIVAYPFSGFLTAD
jgi:hypothetical protein